MIDLYHDKPTKVAIATAIKACDPFFDAQSDHEMDLFSWQKNQRTYPQLSRHLGKVPLDLPELHGFAAYQDSQFVKCPSYCNATSLYNNEPSSLEPRHHPRVTQQSSSLVDLS